jgi:hypothetical protein
MDGLVQRNKLIITVSATSTLFLMSIVELPEKKNNDEKLRHSALHKMQSFCHFLRVILPLIRSKHYN